MKLKVLSFILIFSMLLFSCNEGFPSTMYSEDEPYILIEERNSDEQIEQIKWKSILKKIPSDDYIQYPGLHSAPVTATLYKNGQVIELDVYDSRLVKLMNFYHNEVYYEVYSYSQGATNEVYERDKECDLRLELTFVSESGSFETSFDKMLVCGYYFMGIRSYIPFGEDDYSTYMRIPLFSFDGNWLELFGF